MKKFLLAFLLISCLGKCYGFAPENSCFQDSIVAGKAFRQKQTIWVNVGQLQRQEVQVSYERYLTNWFSVELTGGYKYAVIGNQPHKLELSSMLNLDTYDYAERMKFSEGILGSLAARVYFKTKAPDHARTYISPQFFYRHRNYQYKFIESNTLQPDNRQTGLTLQTLDMQIYGGKLLIGRTISLFDFRNKTSFLVDIYGGFGWRQKQAKTTYFWYDSQNPLATPLPPQTPPAFQPYFPRTIISEKTLASLQLGFKIGYQF